MKDPSRHCLAFNNTVKKLCTGNQLWLISMSINQIFNEFLNLWGDSVCLALEGLAAMFAFLKNLDQTCTLTCAYFVSLWA